MWGWTISSATMGHGALGEDDTLPEEGQQRREEQLWTLNVRHVAAVVQDDAHRAEGTRGRLGRRERNRIVPPVNQQRRHLKPAERGNQVVVAERAPDGLLHSAGDAKWREVVRSPRIREVAGDARLERPLAIRLRVPLPQAGLLQRVAQR